MENKKIILDTNIWISFLITKKYSQLDKLIENKKITLIFSEELIEEFIDVVSRHKFKKYLSKKDIEKILEYFDEFGELVKVKSDIQICRDEKDNFLLNSSFTTSLHLKLTMYLIYSFKFIGLNMHLSLLKDKQLKKKKQIQVYH